MEEAGELGRAVLKDDQPEFVDAIGDMVVVLTNMAHLGGTTIEECIDAAYKVISQRELVEWLTEHLLKMKSKTIEFRDPVVENVVDKFVSRSDVGFAKYGRTLHSERTGKHKDLSRLS